MVSAGLVTKDRDGTEEYTKIPDAVYALTNKRDFTWLEGVLQQAEIKDAPFQSCNCPYPTARP